jgi:pyruvate dehydrogenase E2 component (dihydrolipoamide acetyltransferase)
LRDVFEVRVPQLGEGLREVRIVELLRVSGDAIRRGDPMYVIETDKSTVELESPEDGLLIEWCVAPGDVIPIGGKVAVLGTPGAANAESITRAAPRTLIPPRTRAYARTVGLSDNELEALPAATGKLLPADIDAHLARRGGAIGAATVYRERKLTPVQRALVYRLRRSAGAVIPGTIAVEIPSTWLLVERLGAEEANPTAFQRFCHAVAQVAKGRPKFRSVMHGDDVLREYEHVNVGLALARPNDELITAVVNGAERLTLPEFVRACGQQMRTALRDGDQAAEDTQIMLTHLGKFGITDALPTLVAPASSVFFLGAPNNSAGRTRIVMTFDHRLINGASAAKFLDALTALLRPSDGRLL